MDIVGISSKGLLTLPVTRVTYSINNYSRNIFNTSELTHSPWRFCRKMCFEASQVVFWSLLCYKELKLITKPFAGRTLCGFLIQMQKLISACEVRACAESKISQDTVILTFTFCFFFSSLFWLSCLIFCFFCWALVGFILVGKVFRNASVVTGGSRGESHN